MQHLVFITRVRVENSSCCHKIIGFEEKSVIFYTNICEYQNKVVTLRRKSQRKQKRLLGARIRLLNLNIEE